MIVAIHIKGAKGRKWADDDDADVMGPQYDNMVMWKLISTYKQNDSNNSYQGC